VVSGNLFTCYVTSASGLFCDKLDNAGNLTFGPDPGGTGITEPPSLAYYSGRLYLIYRKSTTVYWRRLEGSMGSWSWGAEQAAGFSSFVPPVLASSNEDGNSPGNHLFVVYANNSTRRLAYRRFTGTGWGPEWLAGQADEVNLASTAQRPAAAMHRGRLQVAIHGYPGWYSGADKDIFSLSCLAPCEYTAPAPSCTLPENAQQWTRMVQQEGGANYGLHLDTSAASDGYLYLWHRLETSDVLHYRAKYSR
jgi:hypothetical protein